MLIPPRFKTLPTKKLLLDEYGREEKKNNETEPNNIRWWTKRSNENKKNAERKKENKRLREVGDPFKPGTENPSASDSSNRALKRKQKRERRKKDEEGRESGAEGRKLFVGLGGQIPGRPTAPGSGWKRRSGKRVAVGTKDRPERRRENGRGHRPEETAGEIPEAGQAG